MTEGNFVDYVKINISSGNGGKGSAHFRREKYITKGGPDGGDGGRGGHIIFKTDKSLWTLYHFKFKKHFKCGHGGDGSGSRSTGADGEDVIILNGTGLDDRGNERSLKLFIGFDTYSIYKLEFSKVPLTGKSMDGIYVYKKNLDGKLYLSYHNREYKAAVKVTERIKNLFTRT